MTLPNVRPDLQELTGYHSAQVSADVRLNTNESPFGPPDAFVQELESVVAQTQFNRYPDRSMTTLRTALASLHAVTPDEIFSANGSNEVLQSLLLAYGGAQRHALVFEPTYALHSHIARITGTSVVEGTRDASFRIDPSMVRDLIEQHAPYLTFFCSPNNPTGLSEPHDVIRTALDAGTGLVVVDEAYGQFASQSASDLRTEPGGDRIVVVRTFSKTWSLAAVRLGYALADPAVVAACAAVALPYNVPTISQAAGALVVSHEAEMLDHVAAVIAERDAMIEALSTLAVTVWPSEANFILFRPLTRDARAVWDALLMHSVLVRDCSTWRGLDGCLRVTVGTATENARFLDALKEVL